MSDTPFDVLTSESEWADVLKQSEEAPVLIFKHSSACPVSAKAHVQMEELAETDEVSIHKVVVQDHRSVSDAIEEDLSVRHETPQAIVVHNGASVFDTSHFDVTADTLRDELRQASLSSN